MQSSKDSLQQLRQAHRNTLRKANLASYLNSQRKNLQKVSLQNEQQQLSKVLPLICAQTYPQHKSNLRRYCYNDVINFRLVGFVGLVVEYLVEVDGGDEDSWLILEVLTQFQEAELPECQMLAGVVVGGLLQYPLAVLNMVDNIVRNRNSTPLRQYLLEERFLEASAKLLQSSNQQKAHQYLSSLLLSILSRFLTLQPLLPLQVFTQITSLLHRLSHNNITASSTIFSMLSNMSCFKQDRDIAMLLIDRFQQLMTGNYALYQEEFITFVVYCVKSGVDVGEGICGVMRELLGSTQGKVRERTLKAYALLLNIPSSAQIAANYQTLTSSDCFLQTLLSLPPNLALSSIPLYLSLLQALISPLTTTPKELPTYLQIISQCLIHIPSTILSLQIQQLEIVKQLIIQLSNKWQRQKWENHVESSGIMDVVEKIGLEGQNQDVCKVCACILDVYEEESN